MKNLIGKIVTKLVLPHSRIVYAQAGEDLLISQCLGDLGILQPTYLDVGANNPEFISNTYFFYLRGSRGVCIEPNPMLAAKIKKVRPRDTVLNIGIGFSEESEADFYVFSGYADGLSTFSKEDAERWQKVGVKGLGAMRYDKVIKLPLRRINDIIAEHFTAAPDLLSIDVEGLDLQILNTLDFDTYRPSVICVETLSYDEHLVGYKRNDIIEFLLSRGYKVYADTHINTIFRGL